MDVKWYYSRNMTIHGPYSSGQLQQLITDGDVWPSDSVWREGYPRWVIAANVPGLFTPSPDKPTPRFDRRRQEAETSGESQE